MEAMTIYDDKFDSIMALSNLIWEENAAYPERDELFAAVGETYDDIANLLHANDALNPIYDGIKVIFEYFQKLHGEGMDKNAAMAQLVEINNNRK